LQVYKPHSQYKMDHVGSDLDSTGSVIPRKELEEVRKKRGQCIKCGRKCFKKKLFKMIPLDDDGRVLNGRCLRCNPLDASDGDVISASARPATPQDLERFNRMQQQQSPSLRSMSSRGLNSPMGRSDSRSVGSASNASPSQQTSRGHSPMRQPGPPPVFERSHRSSSRAATGDPQPSRTMASSSVSNASSHGSDDFVALASPAREVSARRGARRNYSRSPQRIRSEPILDNGVARPPQLDSIPTTQELQQAEAILSAARIHGVIPDHEEYDDVLDDGDNVDGSYGSIPSAHSRGSYKDYEFEFDGDERPQHGILDRGGAFPGSRPRENRVSSRSQGSRYEEGEDSNRSMLSQHTPSSRQSSRSHRSPIYDSLSYIEQSYIHEIREVGHDFFEIFGIMEEREALNSPIVVREALKELANLHLVTEDHDALADMEAPVLVTEAILQHADDLEVQLWGCDAIWNMSGTERNQLAFVDAGALDVVLSAMDRFIGHMDIQEKAIATISNLAAAEDNMYRLVERGAIGLIVEAMNKHSEVAIIQLRGCAAITNLTSHDSPLKQEIMKLGGGGAVVIAMIMHPEESFLQEKALRALRNLCANCEENKVELTNIGGIDATISAMQIHRDEAGVQEEGAWTLSNLAGNDENKVVIGDCGGVEVIVRAMWVHTDQVGVQEWCTRALFTLTLDHDNVDHVLRVGGIAAIVHAMQAHGDSPVVQEMGCAVLGNLARTDQSKTRIVEEEALDAIVLAMVLHAEDLQLQERACIVLLRLAIHENAQAMRAANIPELVQMAAEKFPERCQELASRLIEDLLFEPSNQTRQPSSQHTSSEGDEEQMRERDRQLHMNQTDDLLYSVFPRHIAEALRQNKKVEPEHHDCVTIFFSDIVGFTDISSNLDPAKINALLDRLYNSFDALSNYHDVFKVETIGDAYMAVTNLTKNQPDHCKRIAQFAIDAIRAANETLIDNDDPSLGYVNIRVGFHSGPVVSGVVGSRNPRYCLFGDTVNTASRMESNSLVNRIHCSENSARLLQQQDPEMKLASRGIIAVKGKGEMNTYWVNEEDP